MVGSGSARRGGDADSGSDMASRSSRRSIGQQPEEHEDSDTIMRRARQANAAKRKAAQEAKESSAHLEEESGSAVQKAHHASLDGSDSEKASEEKAALSRRNRDPSRIRMEKHLVRKVIRMRKLWTSPVWRSPKVKSPVHPEAMLNILEKEASDNDAVEVEAPEEDRVPDSSPEGVNPDAEPEVREESPRVKQEARPLSPVQEEAVFEDILVSSPVPLGFQMPTLHPDEPPFSAPSEAPRQETPRFDVPDSRMEEPPEASSGTSEVQMTGIQMKAYVAEQEFYPDVGYDWPLVHLNPESFIQAASMTWEYLSRRMLMPAQTDAWISELQIQRRTFGRTGDVQAAMIPLTEISPRECIPLLQTMLFEAGFGFVNLVPGWFRTRVFKVHPDLVGRVIGEMLQLLVVEITEWRQLVNRAQKYAQALAAFGRERLYQVHPEAQYQGVGVFLSDYEVSLLGRDFTRHLKSSGFRKVQSPRRPTYQEIRNKRVQRVMPRSPPSSIPHPRHRRCSLYRLHYSGIWK
ncbi:hypothetical protein P3T76_013902 [Phytophthora citrophthora]|uniref:Uncharacterized protein n=1 Tax=Phytophthora citrophthora TaxID=4793 RepID=A0AAD9G2S3_9STRA|nr:hypothetical protein P3T76_013902 [Phytophthora citrophthora]